MSVWSFATASKCKIFPFTHIFSLKHLAMGQSKLSTILLFNVEFIKEIGPQKNKFKEVAVNTQRKAGSELLM